jgi:hypothetical protein
MEPTFTPAQPASSTAAHSSAGRPTGRKRRPKCARITAWPAAAARGPWQALPDRLREVGARHLVGGDGAVGDAAGRAQRLHAVARREAAHVEEIAGQVARGQQAPVHRQPRHDAPGQRVDDGGAVGRQRVVEAGRARQRLAFAQVGQEQRAHLGLRQPHAVHVDVFAAHVGAHAKNVVLVGRDEAGLELLEEAADGREALAALLADLDGKGQEAPVVEAERHQRVRDGGAAPVGERHVDRAQPVEVVAARFPARGVVGVAAPVEVAHVVQGDDAAVGMRPDLPRHVVGPRAVLRGRDGAPPAQQQREADRVGKHGALSAAAPQQHDGGQGEQAHSAPAPIFTAAGPGNWYQSARQAHRAVSNTTSDSARRPVTRRSVRIMARSGSGRPESLRRRRRFLGSRGGHSM